MVASGVLGEEMDLVWQTARKLFAFGAFGEIGAEIGPHKCTEHPPAAFSA